MVLTHDAFAVLGVHVAHLDTAGAVAANTAWTTHEQLAGRLGTEQTFPTGGVKLGWGIADHFFLF